MQVNNDTYGVDKIKGRALVTHFIDQDPAKLRHVFCPVVGNE
jgi:hypothetical protein